ncbi:hypothetical protein B0A52_05555 [Exophiala mesophila]|uniref:Uncharacterized protein n=1 Tax=Exophiala mesophila TaxID=212818 RepID=A0A438N396_EXOME|nr:hypothetical protein B0A52_05555 [Exophiala mesophila]
MDYSLNLAFFLLLLNTLSLVNATCLVHTPAYPSPNYTNPSAEFRKSLDSITDAIRAVANDPTFNTSSFSIEITSESSTLYSAYHTAQVKDSSRPGVEVINGDSAYRIASISKTFTVLGLLYQHAAGNLSLDESVATYLPDLVSSHPHVLPWEDITLRTLASQLSGLPRDFSQGDLAQGLPNPLEYGFPPVNLSGLPHCNAFGNYTPCKPIDLYTWLSSTTPVFAPKYKSTYSNIAFDLLGLVLANVTGSSFEDYIRTSILDPLNMTLSSFTPPPDSFAVLPKDNRDFWDVDLGIDNPTGGLYVSASDMSKYLRYILTHYNGITNALNWFQPVSFTQGISSYYGIPWETFRTDKILPDSRRPVTFYTKGGGLPGYSTLILLVPEYALGITILTAGNPGFVPPLNKIVTTKLIPAADKLAQEQAQHRYTGTYHSHNINTTLAISHDSARGLMVSNFISNGTDTLSFIFNSPLVGTANVSLQLIPTGLYHDEKTKHGEIFTAVFDVITPNSETSGNIWDDFCVTDVSPAMYAGKRLGEVIFWDLDPETGKYSGVQMPAFRVWLHRQGDKESDSETMFVQDL